MGRAVNPEETPLLVLVEGINDEWVLREVLKRGRELMFTPLSEAQVEFRRHSSEVCTRGAEIVRTVSRHYGRFLLVWDYEGSAQQARGVAPSRAQGIVQSQLNTLGMRDRAKAVVIAPELEIWLWSDLDAVAKALGQPRTQIDSLLNALAQKERLTPDAQPKETLKRLASLCNDRADSSLYERITKQAKLDAWLREHWSFKSLVRALRRWFPLRA